MPQFPANIDLSTLDGSTGFKLSGTAAGDRSGWSVASAGDVNGDGFADLIVGAIFAAPNGSQSGAGYVVFGQASGFAANIDLSSLDGTTGFKLSGAAAGDTSGWSVASAGDVNGDGFADLIVGANGPTRPAPIPVRATWCSARPRALPPTSISRALDGSHRLQAQRRGGGRPERHLGGVGRRRQRRRFRRPDRRRHRRRLERHERGRELRGVRQGLGLRRQHRPGARSTAAPGFKLSGVAADDRSGSAVASAGDVNGDGFADLIVGAYYADPNGIASAGASYVVFGKASGFAANIDALAPSTAPPASSSAARRQATGAAGRWRRPATSTATASTT